MIRNSNTYIKRNSNGAPVTCSQREAEKFEYSKAKNILDSLPKGLKRFHFQLEAIPEISPHMDVTKKENVLDRGASDSIDVIKTIENPAALSPEVTRWIDKIQTFNGLAKEAEERKKELSEEHAAIERKKIDVEHDIEFTKRANACVGYKKFRELQRVLERRREIKDELFVLGLILGSSLGQVAKDHIEKSIEGLTNRKYTYREQE